MARLSHHENMIHLNKIGLEIEGEWSEEMIAILQAHEAIHEVKHDGSIRDCASGTHDDMCRREVTTKPIPVNAQGQALLKGLFALLERAYENGEFHYNKSCGFHVHTSYVDDNGIAVLPDTIASSPFYVSFAQAVKTRYPKVYEARKENQYCRLSNTGEEGIAIEADSYATSVLEGSGHTTRYRFINLEAWRKYGTIEFRFFPASKPAKMREYLQFIMEQVNTWLNIETLSIDCSEPIPEAMTYDDIPEVITPFIREHGMQEVYRILDGAGHYYANAKARRLSVRRYHASIAPRIENITLRPCVN